RGKIYKIEDLITLAAPKKGAIVVARFTTPPISLALAAAEGIICETGGVTSHAALIAREFGKPCLVGVTGALAALAEGQEVILDADAGEVYETER
ncbi:MAG: phosphoenolpyruvate synthase, partial [Patescibacteria group bacterium]|nr:phosphoenolpyruvate synthase [Patescibacteria group bacterium]